MLRKLLKHEFRATARIMLPLYLVVLLTAAGANLSIRFCLDSSDNTLVTMLYAMVIAAFVIALISTCVISLVVMIRRFYKNLLGDEGYIMFTLPVSVHRHIFSKLLVSAVWFAATTLIAALALLILVFDVDFVEDVLGVIGFLLRQLDLYHVFNGTAIVAEIAALAFLFAAVTCLQFYAAMSIGHSFSSHKLLLSVVFYFGLQFAMQTITTLAGAIPTAVFLTDLAESIPFFSGGMYITDSLHAVIGLSATAMLLQGAVYYFLTAFMLKRRLNLE